MFKLRTKFLKNQTLFKKLKYCFLVESTTITCATFLYITALSKAKVKTNLIRNTK